MFYEHSCKSLYVHIQEHNMLTVFSKARFLNLHTLQNLDSEFFTVRACPVNYSIFRAFLFFFFLAVQPLLRSGPGSLGAGVLGHSLGALGHGVLGQLPRQQQTHGRLDLPGCQCGSTRVLGQPGGLAGQPLKQIVHERVHDAHGLGGDADVRVHLLRHLIDVHGVGFFAPAAPSGLLVPRTPAPPAPRLLQLSVLGAHPPLVLPAFLISTHQMSIVPRCDNQKHF